MSPVRETKDGRGKCIFYGSLPQETGGLTPMYELEIYKPTIIMSWEKVHCVTSYNVGRSRGGDIKKIYSRGFTCLSSQPTRT